MFSALRELQMIGNLPSSHPTLGTPTKIYPYRDIYGNTIAAVYKFTSANKDGENLKEIRPYCLEKNLWSKPLNPNLYELDILKEKTEAPIIIVEGEKCADALNKIGLLATTSMGGSNAAHKTGWSILKDRHVIIWPDADDAGYKYAQAVCNECFKVGVSSVNILSLNVEVLKEALINPVPKDGFLKDYFLKEKRDQNPFESMGENLFALKQFSLRKDILPKGWDCADAISEGWTLSNILALLSHADNLKEKTLRLSDTHANDNWPEPDMSVIKTDTPPPTFPLEIFPPDLALWLKQSAHSKSAPVDYLAATLLAATASLIGSSRKISPWPGWSEPPILWAALVGSPSAGKSPAMDPVLSILSHMEGECLSDYEEALRIYETDKLEAEFSRDRWEKNVKSASEESFSAPILPANAIAPEKPTRKRLMIKDATSEAMLAALKGQPKGFLMVRDELAGWFANMDRYAASKGGDRALWLEAYGGRPYTLDRVKNGGDPFHIPSLAISVIGGIQPDRLETCILKGDDDGLSSRFLYFYPRPVPRQRPSHIPNYTLIETVLNKLDALKPDLDDNNKPISRTIPLMPDASNLFESWWQNLQEKSPDTGRMAGWWGKSQGIALRIALILEYLNWAVSNNEIEPREVSTNTIQKALHFIDSYAAPMAEKVHGIDSHQAIDANTKQLAKYIQDNKYTEFSVRDLQRSGPLRSLKANKIKEVCYNLAGLGWLKAAPIRNGNTVGKPQGRFTVNSSILS